MRKVEERHDTPSSGPDEAGPDRGMGTPSGQSGPERPRHLAVLGVLVVALALVVGGAWRLVPPHLAPPRGAIETPTTDYPGPGGEQIEVTVSDAAPQAIAQELADAGVVATEQAFVVAYDENEAARDITAGTYQLRVGMPAAAAVAALLDPASTDVVTLTVAPTWTADQILARVSEVLDVPDEEVESAATELELPGSAEGELEGWLAADAYSFEPGIVPQAALQQMVDRTVADLDERGVAPQDYGRVLTIASIVQAEVADPEAQSQVARVIENRLGGCTTSGQPILQLTSTVAYGMQTSIGSVTVEDTRDADNPFNTYVHEGLPPTPIGSPSAAAVAAAVGPAEGPWCYFVTVNPETGETRFTDDPAEHAQNRSEYNDWLQAQDRADG